MPCGWSSRRATFTGGASGRTAHAGLAITSLGPRRLHRPLRRVGVRPRFPGLAIRAGRVTSGRRHRPPLAVKDVMHSAPDFWTLCPIGSDRNVEIERWYPSKSSLFAVWAFFAGDAL